VDIYKKSAFLFKKNNKLEEAGNIYYKAKDYKEA